MVETFFGTLSIVLLGYILDNREKSGAYLKKWHTRRPIGENG